ncbi:MAG: hypothetical protein ABI651_12200 [Verrucomicrobiota bacterium]
MSTPSSFVQYSKSLREFILRHSHGKPASEAPCPAETDRQFEQFAFELFALQFQHNSAYRQICRARGVIRDRIGHWTEIPSVPTTAFKQFALTSLPPTERTTVFYSSGTTAQRPSRHFHNRESLSLYEASLRPWFQIHFLPNIDLPQKSLNGARTLPLRFVTLSPSPAEAPRSSLVHMFDTVRRTFGSHNSIFTGMIDTQGLWKLDMAETVSAIRESISTIRPIALLGTAFSFVHLLDHLVKSGICRELPAGSRVLETGGYKGRSRSLPKEELHALISGRLGIPETHIICEYGMSELSSQAYDRVACAELAGFHFPPWARARIISPETGAEVADGETGLIQVFDLANVNSVMAVQTEDLAIRHGRRFELIGRTELAEPRGCSLMSHELS